MKALLIYSNRDCRSPRVPLEFFQDIHIGISYISAALRAGGHTTRAVVLSSEWEPKSWEMLAAAICDFDPQLIAFTSVFSQYPFVSRMARRVKARWPDKFLLSGGTCISLDPQTAMRDPFDAICIGEGEYPTVELAAALEAGRFPHGIPNLWIRTPAGSVETNPTREFLPDLDHLPLPDRQMWEPWIDANGRSRQVVSISRGCPYQCPYCCNHALRKLAGGHYVRFRSPGSIVVEVEYLRRAYPSVREVYLQSETIAMDLDWVSELGDKLNDFNRLLAEPVSFACNLRVAPLCRDDRLFAALEKANVRTIEIGLESGSERVRREVLRRHYTNQEFLAAVNLARQHGMKVNVYSMIGLPSETPEEHEETVELNRRVSPGQCYPSIFYPYPNTDLYALCQEQGLLKHHRPTSRERSRATLDLPTFPRAQIQRACDWFEFRVYRGQRPFILRLRRLISRKVTSFRWLRRIFVRLLPLWHRLRRGHNGFSVKGHVLGRV